MASPTLDSPSELDPYRLPTTVRPSRYDVHLTPDLDAATFAGAVTIAIDVETTVDVIVLNAAELEITSCLVNGLVATTDLDAETDRLRVTPSVPLAPGSATLAVSFNGILNDKLRGFYRSTYSDDDGAEHIIATTQMQSTDCRRAFPCWDEPEFKAIFGITLDVANGLTAISNSPEIRRDAGSDRTVIGFGDTMVMSTYLVAFVVGELEMTDTVDVDGTPMRVVHVPGKGHLTDFGLDVGAFSLRWFQDYYGIAYPGEKVDLVALPDFAAGAMENLGCITFRENLLLVDPNTSTQAEQQNIADVIAHELAHMWFGDLVTMRWWNGIWLNEAFATFMEIAACDAYRPDWERWTSFGLERSFAFDTDSLENTRSVEYEVRSPQDCEGMFDVLTYQKGGALLRMLEQYLGAETFREGVSHYLSLHAYANTETNDLWDAIETTSGEPVRRLMDSWIWQPGYPLITASCTSGTDGTATLHLSQERFRFADDAAIGDDSTWVVPIHLRVGGTESVVRLDGDTLDVALDDPAAPIVVNAGGHGFFRVAYDDDLRQRLTGTTLASLSTLERYSLVDDAWAATVAGRLSAVEMLDFLEGFVDEREHAVWQAMAIALRGLGRLVDDTALDGFRSRVRSLAAPAFRALGDPSPDESDLTGKLRSLLTSTMGVLGGDAAIQARCREVFDQAAADPTSVDAEVTAAATAVVAASGDEATYDMMQQGFLHGDTPQQQLRNLYALASFDDAELVQRTCEFAMSDAVKSQNAPFLLRLAMANRDHGAVAWNFIKRNWTETSTSFPSNTIVRMIDSVSTLASPELVHDTATFFAEHPIEQAMKTMEQVLERQRVNSTLRSRDGAALSAHVR